MIFFVLLKECPVAIRNSFFIENYLAEDFLENSDAFK